MNYATFIMQSYGIPLTLNLHAFKAVITTLKFLDLTLVLSKKKFILKNYNTYIHLIIFCIELIGAVDQYFSIETNLLIKIRKSKNEFCIKNNLFVSLQSLNFFVLSFFTTKRLL